MLLDNAFAGAAQRTGGRTGASSGGPGDSFNALLGATEPSVHSTAIALVAIVLAKRGQATEVGGGPPGVRRRSAAWRGAASTPAGHAPLASVQCDATGMRRDRARGDVSKAKGMCAERSSALPRSV